MTTIFSEKTLIVRSQQGDLEAFNQLVLHYQDGLYRYAMSMVNDSDLAEDVTQESFIKAFQNIKTLYGDSFRAWLFKIATNTAHDITRRTARHPLIPLYPTDENDEELESPYWLIDPNFSVEETVQSDETSARLRQLLDELPEVHRNVLTLIDLQDMDYTEAAKILNIPLGTVKSRLARARLQLKLKLLGNNNGHTLVNSVHALAI